MLLTGIYKIKSKDLDKHPQSGEKTPNILMMGDLMVGKFLKSPPNSDLAKPGAIVVFSTWRANPKLMLKSYLHNHLLQFKGYKVVWGAVDFPSTKKLNALGLNCSLLQGNLFCRDDIFKPIMEEEIVYDAIYACALEDYKRPWLASEIKRLRIATRSYNKDVKSVAKTYKIEHALINTQWVKRRELAKEINKSRCGLALSKEEGAMYATTDYLLCGVPVVSTPSQGGRALWFTPTNHLICSPSSESVKNTVTQIIERQKSGQIDDRETIAKATRNHLVEEKKKLINLCQENFGLRVDLDSLQPQNYSFLKENKTTSRWEEIDIVKNPDP